MTAYATSAELAGFSSYPLPSDPDRQLQRASELLDSIVVRPFTVDAVTGLPEDEDVAAALRDACCAQVEFWSEVGEANDIDGLAGTQVSVGSYSGLRAPKVAPRALLILRNVSLMVGPLIPTALLRDAASVEVYKGDSAHGPQYEPPVTVACRLEPRRRRIRSGDGVTVEAVGRLFCRSDVAVTPQSRVTLADAAYIVLSVAAQPGLSGPSHQELELGVSEADD